MLSAAYLMDRVKDVMMGSGVTHVKILAILSIAKILFVKSIMVLVVRARQVTGVTSVTILVVLKTVNHQVVIVRNREAETAMNVKLVVGDRCVRTNVHQTVWESVRKAMENVLHVFLEHGTDFAMQHVWVNIVNIAIIKQDNVKNAKMAIGAYTVTVNVC